LISGRRAVLPGSQSASSEGAKSKLKADANLGVRFWHLGQEFNFSPARLGLGFNDSQNWADILIGGHAIFYSFAFSTSAKILKSTRLIISRFAH